MSEHVTATSLSMSKGNFEIKFDKRQQTDISFRDVYTVTKQIWICGHLYAPDREQYPA
jgi:hypothetical protein